MTRNLILVPTSLERDGLLALMPTELHTDDRVELCGFGLVAAAARTSLLIADLDPQQVLLVGIAGSLSDRLPVGSAAVFDDVSCYGIGAGSGSRHLTAGDMGWYHLGGRAVDESQAAGVIADTISLRSQSGTVHRDTKESLRLLTVSSASASSEEVEERCRRFPEAVAEDMEGFAVALSCGLAEIPVMIMRGISNEAGDRHVPNWRIEPALKAVGVMLADRLMM